MEDLLHLQTIFQIAKRGIRYTAKHLSLILLVPAILGGIWQIIELSQMSFSYIRFFSASQVLADGLLLLLMLVFFAGTFFFTYMLHYRYVSSTSDDDDDGTNEENEGTGKNYIRCLVLFLTYILLLSLELYTLSRILQTPDSIVTLLVIFPVATIFLYLALGAYIFASFSVLKTAFYSIFLKHTIWLWFATIAISIFLATSAFRKSFALPKDLLNADIILHQIAAANPETEPTIIYNNDKYLFIDLNNFFFLHEKPVNGGMLIVPVEDIFNLSEVKYKLPDHTKAAYHFQQRESRKNK